MSPGSRLTRSTQNSMRSLPRPFRGPTRRPYTTESPSQPTPTPPPQPRASSSLWRTWWREILPAWGPVIFIATGTYMALDMTRAALVHERLTHEARQQIQSMESELGELQSKSLVNRRAPPVPITPAVTDATRPPPSPDPIYTNPKQQSAEQSPGPSSGWWQKLWWR